MPSFKVLKAELMRGRWPYYLLLVFSMLPLGAGPDGASDGSSLRQFVLGILFLAAAFTIARFPDRIHLVRSGTPLTLVLLLLYITISASWSPSPYVSIKRAMQVIGVALVAAALLAGGNGNYRIHRLTPPVLWAAMVLAILVTIAFPSYAFSDIGYRAFMATKNNFGQLAVLCTFMPLALIALDKGNLRWVWLLLAALGALGLVLSRSATSITALLAVFTSIYTAQVIRQIHRSWWPPIISVGAIALTTIFVYFIFEGFPVLDDLLSTAIAPTGKDLTLTGRTYLWDLMLTEAMQHPWFGSGYGGFWMGLEGASGQIAYLVKWGYPGQAHNGYIDLFNELGIVGCTLVTAFVVNHAFRVRALTKINPPLGYFHASILMLVLVLNLAEATFLRTTHLWWIIFTASVLEVNALIHQSIELNSKKAETQTRTFK